MTDKARETIAALIGVECEASAYGCVTGTYDAADAILAALPSIIADMVPDLVWEGVEGDCFVTCDTEPHTYDLLVFDTLERPHDFVWSARAVPPLNPRVSDSTIGNGSFEDVVKAANAHNRAVILKSLGMKEGE